YDKMMSVFQAAYLQVVKAPITKTLRYFKKQWNDLLASVSSVQWQPALAGIGPASRAWMSKAKEGVKETAINMIGKTGDEVAGKGKGKANFVNIASKKRTKHILYGDKTGGGHLWPGTGNPNKTLFPKNWSAERVMHNVSDIATDPTLKWKRGRVVKSVQRYEVIGIRDGIKIKVITDGKDIITAFPIK
ncbi:EndoU domain-containing protein, partial [Parageobacillus thermoglucosidasius]